MNDDVVTDVPGRSRGMSWKRDACGNLNDIKEYLLVDCYHQNMTDSTKARNKKLRALVTTNPVFANRNGESLEFPDIGADAAGTHVRSLIRAFKGTFMAGGVNNKKGDFNRVEHILHQIAKAEMEEEARRGDTKEKEKEEAAAAAAMEVRILSLAGAAGKEDAARFKGHPPLIYLSLLARTIY